MKIGVYGEKIRKSLLFSCQIREILEITNCNKSSEIVKNWKLIPKNINVDRFLDISAKLQS